MARLLAAIEEEDREGEHYSEQDVLEEFANPYLDCHRGSIAAFDRDAAMIGYCQLLSRADANPEHQMRLAGGVHPGCRGRGIGRKLLMWAETAALPLHQERFPGKPLSLCGQANARNAAAVALYEAHGYEPARYFHLMECDLAGRPPTAAQPSGAEIVQFTRERIEDARMVRNDAFRGHWGSTDTTAEGWEHRIRQAAFRPEFSFLAYAGSEPQGVLISEEWDADTAATGKRDLYVAIVGTREGWRKRGLASALLGHALDQARAAGFRTASLNVDADSPTGAVGLYERFGFRVRDTWIAQVKRLQTDRGNRD
jgi:mycothiol synthase